MSLLLGEPLAAVDHIVEEYKKDYLAFYKKVKSTNQRKGMPRFNFRDLARKLFDPISSDKLVKLYVDLLKACDVYTVLNKGDLVVPILTERFSHLRVKTLMLNLITPYQLPSSKLVQNADKSGKKTSKYKQSPPRAEITSEISAELLRLFLKVPLPTFNTDTKLWKQVRFILNPNGDTNTYKQMAPIVAEAASDGHISFAALSYLMQDPILNSCLPPKSILLAIYLGPLKASTVELFASGRSSEFRADCRSVIRNIEKALDNVSSFLEYHPDVVPKSESMKYSDFCLNAKILLDELKGTKRMDNLIPMNWAYAAVKKYAKRTYVDRTWKEENLFDLIWTIIVQRPSMKTNICSNLEKEFHDHGAARYWRHMQPSQMDKILINNPNAVRCDPLSDTEEFLNFPKCVGKISFVRTEIHLQQVTQMILKEVDENGTCMLGLDAEWSAFNGDSKATILQIALRGYIFIVDLDTLPSDHLKYFFENLFLNPAVVNLGFQFSEDLFQLRNAVPHCKPLYEPKNVFCIGKAIVDLLEMTELREDSDEILSEVAPNLNAVADESIDVSAAEDKEGTDVNMSLDDSFINVSVNEKKESAIQRTMNKGLSNICEQFLGRPLDKTEQCSVWDRRPLRALQMRYAAMDAYCMLMLYDVCEVWAVRLGVSLDQVLRKQSQTRVSLPLFSD